MTDEVGVGGVLWFLCSCAEVGHETYFPHMPGIQAGKRRNHLINIPQLAVVAAAHVIDRQLIGQFQGGDQDMISGREVIEQRSFADPGFSGDLCHRDVGVTVPLDEVECGCGDGAAALG
jgi:hypothetical protein